MTDCMMYRFFSFAGLTAIFILGLLSVTNASFVLNDTLLLCLTGITISSLGFKRFKTVHLKSKHGEIKASHEDNTQ